jgi:hypothetical protein
VLGQGQVAIDDQHLGAGAGEQDAGGAAVADAVTGRAAPGHDRDLVHQAPFLVGRSRVFVLGSPVFVLGHCVRSLSLPIAIMRSSFAQCIVMGFIASMRLEALGLEGLGASP